MQLLVVGAGSMGRWLADTVVAHAPGPDDVDVAVADTDPSAAAAAADALDARRVPVDGDERFDAVCLAVPISAVGDSVAAQAPRARAALLDVSGVMRGPVEAMRAAAPDRERVSLHPLFAPANAPGTVARVADAPGPTTDRLCAALSAAGNDLFETTAAEHDRAMETVQAGAHAAVLAYALAAREVRPEFHTPVSTALAEAAEAVTGGTPRVYREIQATFDGADRVAEAAARVAAAAGDDGAFDDLYRAASAAVDSAHAAGAAAEDAESGDADTGERGGSDRSAPGGDGRD